MLVLVASPTENLDILWSIVQRIPILVVSLKGPGRTTVLALGRRVDTLRRFPASV